MDDRSLGGRDVVQGEEQEFSLLPDLFTGGRDTQSLQDRSFAHRKPRGFIASDPVMVRENDCVDRISDFCWKTAKQGVREVHSLSSSHVCGFTLHLCVKIFLIE
jgi:hypothetical protein